MGEKSSVTDPHGRESAPDPRSTFGCVGIGISTGGPRSLPVVIGALPQDLEVPVFVVQHMPEGFTSGFAKSLDRASSLPVLESSAGLRVEPGHVYVAAAGSHLEVSVGSGGIVLEHSDASPVWNCRPAVDVLFRSLAAVYGPTCVGVVMTGMGIDGTDGSRAIVGAGGQVIVQSEASSVVYGMPKVPFDLGLARGAFDLEKLGPEIVRLVRDEEALRS